MGIFKTNKPTNNTPELTQEIAMSIYDQLKERTPKEIFEGSEDSSIDWTHVVYVYEKVSHLAAQMRSEANKMEVKEPAQYNENAELVIPAVMGYKHDTFESLLSEFDLGVISSEVLLRDLFGFKTLKEWRESNEREKQEL